MEKIIRTSSCSFIFMMFFTWLLVGWLSAGSGDNHDCPAGAVQVASFHFLGFPMEYVCVAGTKAERKR